MRYAAFSVLDSKHAMLIANRHVSDPTRDLLGHPERDITHQLGLPSGPSARLIPTSITVAPRLIQLDSLTSEISAALRGARCQAWQPERWLLLRQQGLHVTGHDLSHLLGSLLAGDHSLQMVLDDVRNLQGLSARECIPGSNIRQLPDAGHMVRAAFIELPEIGWILDADVIARHVARVLDHNRLPDRPGHELHV